MNCEIYWNANQEEGALWIFITMNHNRCTVGEAKIKYTQPSTVWVPLSLEYLLVQIEYKTRRCGKNRIWGGWVLEKRLAIIWAWSVKSRSLFPYGEGEWRIGKRGCFSSLWKENWNKAVVQRWWKLWYLAHTYASLESSLNFLKGCHYTSEHVM